MLIPLAFRIVSPPHGGSGRDLLSIVFGCGVVFVKHCRFRRCGRRFLNRDSGPPRAAESGPEECRWPG